MAYVGDVSLSGEGERNFAMVLHKGASLVDGIKIGEFMSGVETDLTNTGVSNCLLQNLESIAGSTVTYDYGGDGGYPGESDPGGIPGGGSSCEKKIKYRTCSTTEDGHKTCTNSSVTTSC